MRLVFDLESDGFLDEATVIHCLVIKDLDTGTLTKFRPLQVEQGLRLLMEADEVIGHNVIKFDLPLCQKLYPWFAVADERVTDTLVLSRLLYPDLSDRDRRPGSLVSAERIGSHSLEAWGQRLDCLKGSFEGTWETFTEEMLDYNEQDVVVTDRLYQLLSKNPALSPKASVLEHKAARVVARQEQYGFPFDEEGALRLTAKLMELRSGLEGQLQDTFKPFYMADGEPKVPKRTINYKDKTRASLTEGAAYTKTKLTVFNPGSRHHIANRLKTINGWEPLEYTPDGSAKVDETVLGSLPWPEAKLLTEYLTLQKRLGQLAEGDEAWLKHVRKGRIHGAMNPNGAVTGRATHFKPNIGQVPSTTALWGHECRSLFHASRTQVGIDVSGLELRMLAHYMARYDNGLYAKEVVEGDVHTVNMKAAGLDNRPQAKTFIYAFLYGAGNGKIGQIVGKGPAEGGRLKKDFLTQTPALAKLIQDVKKAASTRGYLVGLDGRRLTIRHNHAALNTLLQSAGALVCKQWLVLVDEEIERRGWREKANQMAWVHDELQFDVDPDITEEFGQMAVDQIAAVAEIFSIRCPLTGEFKHGQNWADCH